jgi:hypothetical protein
MPTRTTLKNPYVIFAVYMITLRLGATSSYMWERGAPPNDNIRAK